MHDARAIANFLLDLAESRGRELRIMALLKIIYFAHGWYLAEFGRPLIRNDFEAWKDGPVVRAVWDCFRNFGAMPIDGRAKKFNVMTETYQVVPYDLEPEERRLLEAVFGAYGHLDSFRLSDITHEAGSPWDIVWNRDRRRVNLGMRIPNELIRQAFMKSKPPEPVH
jgi:uncharacterized phage-associated protein